MNGWMNPASPKFPLCNEVPEGVEDAVGEEPLGAALEADSLLLWVSNDSGWSAECGEIL